MVDYCDCRSNGFSLLKKVIFLLIVVIFCIFANSAQTQAQTQVQAKTQISSDENAQHFLKIGIAYHKHYPYYFSQDGKFAGLDIDLIKEIANELNLQPKFVEKPLKDLEKSLQNNDGDLDLVISIISSTFERNNKFALSNPYLCTFGTFLFRNQKLRQDFDKNSANRNTMRIGVLKNTRYHHYALTVFSAKNLKVYALDSNDLLMKALEKGDVDIILSEDFIVRDFVNRHKSLPYEIGDHAFTERLVILANKNNSTLIDQINIILQKMLKDGRLEKLSRKHLKSNLLCK